MIHELETTLELAGQEMDCLIRYERDPSSFAAQIYSVELGRRIRCDYDENGDYHPTVEWVSVDITRLLDESQKIALEAEIEIHRMAAAEDAKTERAIELHLQRMAA